MSKENLLKSAALFGLGATIGLYAHGVTNDANCKEDRFTWDDKISICETPEGRIEATNREGQKIVFPESVNSLYGVWGNTERMIYYIHTHYEQYYSEVTVHTVDFDSGEDNVIYSFPGYY